MTVLHGGLFEAIRYELELMREELRSRLFEMCCFEPETESKILYHIKEELFDVEYSLSKFEAGTYGVCELTGRALPKEKLRILPTARTIHDFSFSEQYERKSLPYISSPLMTAGNYPEAHQQS